jgi:hypothetical protein
MKRYLKTIVFIIIVIFFILPNFTILAEKTNSNIWVPISEDGFGNPYNIGAKGIGIYNGELYIGTMTFNNSKKIQITDIKEFVKIFIKTKNFLSIASYIQYSLKSEGCEIWKYNITSLELTQLVGYLPEADINAGFGDIRNSDVTFFKEFKGHLYVGTRSCPLKGCEIWRFDGNTWEQVVNGGFDDSSNFAAWSVEVFNNHIYVGTINCDKSKNGYCQIWRSSDGENWEKVVNNGFKYFETTKQTNNERVWSMKVYKDHLYVGTLNLPRVLKHKGCQLWKTSNGTTWERVKLPYGDGFGEIRNIGISSMEIYDDWLYIGTANTFHHHGFEIWKFNGNDWIPVIGDEVPGVKWNPRHKRNDGFGDKYNFYAYTMINVSNKLWVGTVNTRGCEIFSFDGNDWSQIVGEDENCEIGNGFGNKSTSGIRSMIEYPIGSGKIFVGTSKSQGSNIACQLWMRDYV